MAFCPMTLRKLQRSAQAARTARRRAAAGAPAFAVAGILAAACAAAVVPAASAIPVHDLQMTALWGTTGSQDSEFYGVSGIAAGPDGTLWVCEQLEPRVQQFTVDGQWLQTLAWSGYGAAGVAVTPDGWIYALDDSLRAIVRFAPDGAPLAVWSVSAAGGEPLLAIAASDERVYVATLKHVLEYGANGSHLVTHSFPESHTQVDAVAVATSGEVFVQGIVDNDLPTSIPYAAVWRLGNPTAPNLFFHWTPGNYNRGLTVSSGGLVAATFGGYIYLLAEDGVRLLDMLPSSPSFYQDRGLAITPDNSIHLLQSGEYPCPDCPNSEKVARFAPPARSLIVGMADSTATFTVDGQAYQGFGSFSWPPGSVHTLSVAPSQQPDSGYRLDFAAWSDSPVPSRTFTAGANVVAATARFDAFYELTNVADGRGSVSPPSGWYAADTTLTLHAVPRAEQDFIAWTGEDLAVDCIAGAVSCRPSAYSGAAPSVPITLHGPVTQTAAFLGHGVELTLSASSTDPHQNTDVAADGVREIYLWASCFERSLCALEAGAVGSLTPLAFTAAPGVLQVYGGSELLFAIPTAPPGSPFLLGHFTVIDNGGDLCLGPSATGNKLVAVDCLTFTEWDVRVTGFSSDGSPPCDLGGNGCWESPGGYQHLIVKPGGEPGPRDFRAYPNPFSVSTQFSYGPDGAGPPTIHVFDVRGRRVRTLTGAAASRPGRILWDGRDRDGHPVATGIYFVQLRDAQGTSTKRLVRIAGATR